MKRLDKEEFRIKLEEINKLVQQEDYKGAMNIVDSIDWRRVKNVRTLCVVGEIYAANKRYEDSKEIFLLAYHKASIGKNILYRLIEVSLKMNDIDEAQEFFEEYKEVAANDNTQYVLKYKISHAQNAPLNEQIRILEDYKEREFTEKWSYELAKLYYKAGNKEKCLDLCNEIILWFSEGKYVVKAYDLKMRMGELNGTEKEKYESQFIPKLVTPEEARELGDKPADESENDSETAAAQDGNQRIESIRMDERDLSNMESFQEKISKGIRDIFVGKKKELMDDDLIDADGDEFDLEGGASGTDEIPEELIRTDLSEKEQEDVPVLEPENPQEKKPENPDFSNTIRMPELKIPAAMKNMELKNTPKAPVIPSVGADSEDDADLVKKDFNLDDFNLEDTILAAASAQGIQIPDKKAEELEEPDFFKETESVLDRKESVPKNPSVRAAAQDDVKPLEDEEQLTEEDLQSAEDEFLNGPAARADLNLTDFEDDDLMGDFLEDDEALSEDGYEDEPARELTEEEELEQFIESIQPEIDPLEIIPRERKLTDEERQLFTYFVKVPGLQEQLVDTLCDAQEAAADSTSRTGNIIVMGGRETGKTRLIAALIPAICQELHLEASKVAYVFAEQINDKDISAIFSKLAGGFLVIENANQLTAETVEFLDQEMNEDTKGLTVILEDEKIGMRKLIAKYPKFAKKFTSMINIPVFTNDELVNFARVYTKENGYVIDQMGMLALYNLIGINQKEDAPMNVGAVKELIDTAIAKSQGGIRKFRRNISKKRTDHDGYIVLYEKDFSK